MTLDKKSYQMGVRAKRLEHQANRLLDLAIALRRKTDLSLEDAKYSAISKIWAQLCVEGSTPSDADEFQYSLDKSEQDLLDIAICIAKKMNKLITINKFIILFRFQKYPYDKMYPK